MEYLEIILSVISAISIAFNIKMKIQINKKTTNTSIKNCVVGGDFCGGDMIQSNVNKDNIISIGSGNRVKNSFNKEGIV